MRPRRTIRSLRKAAVTAANSALVATVMMSGANRALWTTCKDHQDPERARRPDQLIVKVARGVVVLLHQPAFRLLGAPTGRARRRGRTPPLRCRRPAHGRSDRPARSAARACRAPAAPPGARAACGRRATRTPTGPCAALSRRVSYGPANSRGNHQRERPMGIAAITIRMSTAAISRQPSGCSLTQVSYSAAALRSSTGSARETSRQNEWIEDALRYARTARWRRAHGASAPTARSAARL